MTNIKEGPLKRPVVSPHFSRLTIITAFLFLFIIGCVQQPPADTPDAPDAPPTLMEEAAPPPDPSPTETPPEPTPTEAPTEAPAETPTETPAEVPTEAPPEEEIVAEDAPPPARQPATDPLPQAGIQIRLDLVAQNFTSPVDLVAPPDGSGRLMIVDQVGLIYILGANGRLQEEPFLDLRDRMVALREGFDERGLLGLAFHPNYAENGRFYVYYSAPARPETPAGWDHTSHVAEFQVDDEDANLADPDSERIVMQIDQPQANHNGGHIRFGPDGYLYIALGDGGGANDLGPGHPPLGNGQDVSALLGSILRIDVDSGQPYAIPPDNPLIGQDGRDEIYAYGLRNPFRISFDRAGDNALYAADVGQDLYEEVNVIEAGGNYGWNIREGYHCFNPQQPGVPPADCPDVGPSGEPLLDPIFAYANLKVPAGNGIGLAVIGGHIYRGDAFPAWQGSYIFGDWSRSFGEGDGRLFIAQPTTSGNWLMSELVIGNREDGRLGEFVLAFGRDEANELYLLTSERSGPAGNTGKVYKIMPQVQSQSHLIDDEPQQYLPLRFEYGRMVMETPVYQSEDHIRRNEPFATHGDGFTWVSVRNATEINDKTYYWVAWDWGANGWVDAEAVQFTAPISHLRGVPLQEYNNRLLAMAYLPVNVRSAPHTETDSNIIGYLDPYDLVTIYDFVEMDDGVWYRIGPDQWSHGDFLRIFTPSQRPEEVGPDEKWIEINLDQQVVIAHEGDRPVYATLTSTGRRAYPTAQGLFRIWSSLREAPMRWENSVPPYSLANVPWIMYFNQDQGLHAAYWHDLFGSVRSAGCVNLSPHDAYWLFQWTDPDRSNQRIKYYTSEEPGTWVWVHDQIGDISEILAAQQLAAGEYDAASEGPAGH